MPLIDPSFFDTKNLFIDVKLSAIVGGSAHNYMGTYYQNERGEEIEVIDIGFYKDNVAFGITNIEITVNTSLQPVIKIDFKDVAGSTSFRGDANKAGINYSQLFNWPPPKFKFSFKGYLGSQVTWLLNLKQYSVGYEPSDGTTKISAEFVPNQFGFFADIPYLYLKAVRKLRELKGESTDKLGVFDIIEIGDQVTELGNAINENYADDEEILETSLGSFEQVVIDEDVPIGSEYVIKVKEGVSVEGSQVPEVEFNTLFIPNKINEEEVTTSLIRQRSEVSEIQVRRWLIANTKINGELLDPNLANLSFDSYADPNRENPDEEAVQRIKDLDIIMGRFRNVIQANIDILNDLKTSEVWQQSETKIGELTISNVIEAIARDSAYLMGAILDAGLTGYFDNTAVRNNAQESLIGLNYPLTNDTNNNNEELPAKGQFGIEEHELDFVREFIKAITEAIAEDNQNSSLPSSPLNKKQRITNRITNLEALYRNPYTKFPKTVATNMLLRSGVAAYLTGSSDPNSPSTSSKDGMRDLAKSDFENIKPFLGEIIKSGEDQVKELKDFCEFFSLIFNDNFNGFIESSIPVDDGGNKLFDGGIGANIAMADDVALYRQVKLQLTDESEVTLGNMLDKFLPPQSRSGVDPSTMRTSYVIIGGKLYPNNISFQSDMRYIVFKGEDADEILETYPATDYDPVSDNEPNGAFEIKYLEETGDNLPDAVENDNAFSNDLVTSISRGEVYSWEKLKKFNNNNTVLSVSDLREYRFTETFKAAETPSDVSQEDGTIYVYKTNTGQPTYAAIPVANPNDNFIGHKQRAFDFLSDTTTSRDQRIFLAELCKLVLDEILLVEKNIKKEQGNLISKFTDAENDIYKQFHALHQQWSSMAQGSSDDTSFIEQNKGNLRNAFSNDFGENHFDYKDPNYRNSISEESSTAFVYQFPLQSISNDGGQGINIKDAIINIDPLRESFNDTNTTVLNVIQNICTKNNFTFIPVPGNPGYDTTEEIFTPQLSSEPQSIFNTFHILFLPTPESRTNLANSSSFQSDLVQMRENVNDNVEGFVVRFGSPDNQIVKSVDVDTVDNKVTAESIINLQALVQSNTETKRVTRDCSMLSVMSGRSYKAKLTVLGNAKIFPTQFFFLERSPLFGGLYQIMNVSHTITPNNMETSFDGIRMRFANSDYAAVLPITKQYYIDLSERLKLGEATPEEGSGESTNPVQGETDYDVEDFSDHDIDLPESAEVSEEIGDLIIDRTYRLNSNEYFSQEFDKKYIFLHHTAGGPKARYVVDGWNKTQFYKSGNRVRVATAYIIGQNDDNRVYECFDPKYWAQHVGISQASNTQFQRNSIGIELCAYGGLKKRDGKFYAWPGDFTKEIPADEVVTLTKKYRGYKYFHAYTDTQIQALEKLLEYIIEEHNIPVQSNFGLDWFEYNREQVDRPQDGIYSHSAVRKDKSDMYPDPRVIGVLRRIAGKYS